MPGTFKAEGAQCLAACAQCAAGKFGDNQQSTSVATYCVDCATGRYESQTGTHSDAASSCTACAAGTHQSLEGKSSCDGCADGTYQTATGQASCDACAAGKYGRANFDCAEGMEVNALGDCTPVRDVTCAFTVDNTIHNVYVDGIDVSGKVSGNLDNWTTRKTYTFPSSARSFSVRAKDNEGGCGNGGFAIKCTTSATGAGAQWNMDSKIGRAHV